jgi:hypothetical protein
MDNMYAAPSLNGLWETLTSPGLQEGRNEPHKLFFLLQRMNTNHEDSFGVQYLFLCFLLELYLCSTLTMKFPVTKAVADT